MSDLRDHSQPCEHGSIETHRVESSLSTVPWPGKFERMCPGGREVTIDYEAAKEQVRIWLGARDFVDEPLIHSLTIDAVAAAIGDTNAS